MQVFPHTFLLPEVCTFLLGLGWSTDIGFSEFFLSIHAAFGKSSPLFDAMLTALQPTLEPWFTAIIADHQHFLIYVL
jgi:hypothetical protein